MRTLLIAVVLTTCATAQLNAQGWAMHQQEIDDQNANFKKWWNDGLVWKFDELPTKGSVEKHRIPYAGHIYPDNGGGTVNEMAQYDRAFYAGNSRAGAWERWDIGAHQVTTSRRGGLFGGRVYYSSSTPYWSGHCNGWTAAAIRHAEPKKSVTRNGVTFTPSQIKGILAEMYTFTETEFLGGLDTTLHPATLHVIMSNWIGRKQHPIAMESTPGREIWNFPVYSYATASARRGGNQVEVKMNIAYKNYTEGEQDHAPSNHLIKYFHYVLELDDNGNIIGGQYYGDSSRLDFLWVPLAPTQGGQEGNEQGNPHLRVADVIQLWRDSVDEADYQNWVNLDTPFTENVAETEDTESTENPDVAVETEANTDADVLADNTSGE